MAAHTLPGEPPADPSRRRFLRRAATVVGAGIGITMTASPAWAPPVGTCVTKCNKAATCYLCGGFTMYKCSCAGSSGYYTCVDKCTSSYCKSYSRCV
jgi:hypothetical protein